MASISKTRPTAAQARVTQTEPATRRPRWETIILCIILGLGSIIMVGPFYWMLVTAFKSQRELLAFPPTFWPENPTLDQWRELGRTTIGSFPVFFRNSVFVTTVITAVTLLTSAMTGYVFAKIPFRGRETLFWVVLGMMMIPFTVSIIPLYALMSQLGWVNTYWSLIIPIAFNPFGIFLLRQYISTISNEYIDAARIDGASEFRIFFRIIWPLATPALAALAIFTFVQQWDNFLWPLVMLNDPNLYTLPLGLAQFRGRVGVNIGPVAAGSIIAILPVMGVYLVAQKQFVEGIAMTGLKG